MMACFLARELGMQEVVVPTTPGVLSALGGLIADLKSDFIKTLYADLDVATAAVIRDRVRDSEDGARRMAAAAIRATTGPTR